MKNQTIRRGLCIINCLRKNPDMVWPTKKRMSYKESDLVVKSLVFVKIFDKTSDDFLFLLIIFSVLLLDNYMVS